ncbi:5459_t:CDS:2, partial [Dentiscutata erythropus]
QEELSEIKSLKRKLEVKNAELSTENIYLDLEKKDLKNTLVEKKNKLAQMKDNLVTTQRALIEKDTLLQEVVLNKAHLTEQIPKTSSESKVAGGVLERPGVNKQKKGNDNASPETTWGLYRDCFLVAPISDKKFGITPYHIRIPDNRYVDYFGQKIQAKDVHAHYQNSPILFNHYLPNVWAEKKKEQLNNRLSL